MDSDCSAEGAIMALRAAREEGEEELYMRLSVNVLERGCFRCDDCSLSEYVCLVERATRDDGGRPRGASGSNETRCWWS